MKKLLVLLLTTIILSMFSTVATAETVDGLSEKIDSMIMENKFSQDLIDEIENNFLEDLNQRFWSDYLPATKLAGKMHADTDEGEYEYLLELSRPDYTYGILMTKPYSKYAKQYAFVGKLNYLLDTTEQYWAVLCKESRSISLEIMDSGKKVSEYDHIVMTKEIIDYLKEKKQLEKLLLESGITKVTDLKLFSVKRGLTLLYVNDSQNEYIIKLYGSAGYCDFIQDIELYKVYPAKEVINAISSLDGEDFIPRQLIVRDMNETKPTYETETQSLYTDGLLKGNENGLDLLKPLTRIEATAILVRAMGFENEQTSGNSYFADIASDNWGVKYANIAKDKGIAEGIGGNMFAPDDTITVSQFVTLILRNLGESPDWQTAVNTFVERGLITQEQADKMDLFTRGDMAKIIYEARQNGMF